MPIFPVMRYELWSSEKPSELAVALSKHTQSWPIITRLGGHKVFAGTVTETGFQLVRVGHNRNSFRPTLFGVFLPDDQSTLIRVTIRHSPYFFVAVAIFFLLFTYLCLQEVALPLLFAALRNDTQEMLQYLSPPSLFFLLSPIAVLLLSYIFSWLVFSSEAKVAKSELAEILSPLNTEPEKSIRTT